MASYLPTSRTPTLLWAFSKWSTRGDPESGVRNPYWGFGEEHFTKLPKDKHALRPVSNRDASGMGPSYTGLAPKIL